LSGESVTVGHDRGNLQHARMEIKAVGLLSPEVKMSKDRDKSEVKQ
jgi:hypothetical protein